MSNYCPEYGKQGEKNSDFCSNRGTKINHESEKVLRNNNKLKIMKIITKNQHNRINMKSQMLLEIKK